MIISQVYKLKPTESQSSTMDGWLSMLCAQYNFRLAERIEAYQQTKIAGSFCNLRTRAEVTPIACSLSKAAIHGEVFKTKKDGTIARRNAYEIQSSDLVNLKQTKPWYKEIYSAVLQQMLRQLDIAFKNFFNLGRGFAKFKRRAAYKSFTYPQNVQFQGNRVYLPNLGWMKFHNSRAFPDGFSVKSVTIRQKTSGWHISVRLEDKSVPEIVPTIKETVNFSGIDLGIKKLATLSNEEIIPNPNFRFNSRTDRLHEIRHRRITRKQKGSFNRHKAQARLNVLDESISRKREDYQWKTAKKIVKSGDVVVFENLNIQGMVRRCKPKQDENGKYLRNGQAAKTGLNRLILDAGWGGLKSKVRSLSTRAGVMMLEINPRHTSQECSVCHHIDEANRDREKFICLACNHIADADIDAAKVIEKRGREQLGLSLDAVRMGSPKQDKSTPLETSLTLVGEPGNQNSKRKVEYIQLDLFALDVQTG